MRRALVPLPVLIAAFLLPAAAADEQTLTHRYERDRLGLGGVGCSWTGEGDAYEGDAACWRLDGSGGPARLTLVDDLLGEIPAMWWADGYSNEYPGVYVWSGDYFCGEAAVEIPEGATFLFVAPEPRTPPRAVCDLGVGLHTDGTITFTRIDG